MEGGVCSSGLALSLAPSSTLGLGLDGALVRARPKAVRHEIAALEEEVHVRRGGAVQRPVALREEEGRVLA